VSFLSLPLSLGSWGQGKCFSFLLAQASETSELETESSSASSGDNGTLMAMLARNGKADKGNGNQADKRRKVASAMTGAPAAEPPPAKAPAAPAAETPAANAKEENDETAKENGRQAEKTRTESAKKDMAKDKAKGKAKAKGKKEQLAEILKDEDEAYAEHSILVAGHCL
tara:strand:+ start:66 stop:575 length:510 start_codon:yes stop_codon:yes gene_type:complete